MTKVSMKAVDTLHITSVGPDNIEAGGKFEIAEADAKILEDRGLATRVGGAKSTASAENKQASSPQNKAIVSAVAMKAPARVAPKAKK